MYARGTVMPSPGVVLALLGGVVALGLWAAGTRGGGAAPAPPLPGGDGGAAPPPGGAPGDAGYGHLPSRTTRLPDGSYATTVYYPAPTQAFHGADVAALPPLALQEFYRIEAAQLVALGYREALTSLAAAQNRFLADRRLLVPLALRLPQQYAWVGAKVDEAFRARFGLAAVRPAGGGAW